MNLTQNIDCFDDVYSKGRESGETHGNENKSYHCQLGGYIAAPFIVIDNVSQVSCYIKIFFGKCDCTFDFDPHLPIFSCHASLIALFPAFSLENGSIVACHVTFGDFLYFPVRTV